MLGSAPRPAFGSRQRLAQTRAGGDSAERRLVGLRGAFRAAVGHHVSAVRTRTRLQTQRTHGDLGNPVSERWSGQRLWICAELHFVFLLQEKETHHKDVAVFRVYDT